MSAVSRFLHLVRHREETPADSERKQYEYTPKEKEALEKLKRLKGSVKI